MRKSKKQIYTDALRTTGEVKETLDKLSHSCPAKERAMRDIAILSLKSAQDSLLFLTQLYETTEY